MIDRNEACWCGSGRKWKKCHYPHPNPNRKGVLDDVYRKKYNIVLKNPQQIEDIRAACRLASQILDEICLLAKAGVTTEELDNLAVKLHKEAGAIAASYHYGDPPFPKSICTSLNEVICHGIPNQVPLKEGDILNIDLGTILNGYFGDNSRMVVIGKTTPERQLVVDVSYECLMRSIAILKPGVLVSDIGKVITDYAQSQGCSVVHQFVAHGVGLKYHEEPQIPHCRNSVHIPLTPGMIFTIEPMINAGVAEAVIDPYDLWTARTRDGKASGQWEHTLLITETGHEILTTWKR
jgi:methionyl aminopeptidase